MARYEKVKIKIEDIGKIEYMDILNTIAHNKIDGIEGLIPFENGEYVARLGSILHGGYDSVSLLSGDSGIAAFEYRTKKLVEDGYNARWKFISYGELLQFEREMEINEVLTETIY